MEAEGKFELIEKYFKNELSGKQLVIFEKRLQNEPELLQEVELQRRLVLAIKEAKIIKILNMKDLAKLDPDGIRNRSPLFDSIKYEGNPFPPFRIIPNEEKSTFKRVKIFPGSGSKTFHYQFKNYDFEETDLYLYGDFDPNKLTLIYYTSGNEEFIKLRIGSKEYTLNKNQPTAPLTE